MGYRVSTSVVKIRFTESSIYYGAEATVESFGVGVYTDIRVDSEILEAFGAHLLEWNLEDDDGTPIPATIEGLATVDVTMAVTMARQWFRRITTPERLPMNAPDGATPQANPNGVEMEPLG